VGPLPTHSILSVGYNSMLAMYCGRLSAKEELRKNLDDFAQHTSEIMELRFQAPPAIW
jgi:hypothetical protein